MFSLFDCTCYCYKRLAGDCHTVNISSRACWYTDAMRSLTRCRKHSRSWWFLSIARLFQQYFLSSFRTGSAAAKTRWPTISAWNAPFQQRRTATGRNGTMESDGAGFVRLSLVGYHRDAQHNTWIWIERTSSAGWNDRCSLRNSLTTNHTIAVTWKWSNTIDF